MEVSKELLSLAAEADRALAPLFADFDKIAYETTSRVMDAFASERVDEACFAATTGYGYGDRGRETLDRVWAKVFECERALVRHNIVNGTHALSCGLFALLRPGDTMLSVTGKPYDTLEEVIGIAGERGNGSLADFGVSYKQVELKDGKIDYDAIAKALTPDVKVVFAQRSKGYLSRPTLSPEELGELASFVHKRSSAYVVIDNCYGEFTAIHEPSSYGADLVIGSLIKNPGGGLARTGGYLCGTSRAVELASYRLTTVGLGDEVGATLGENRNMFQGLFMAPHVVAQAKKTAAFASYIFDKLGYAVEPSFDCPRYDIIQTVSLGSPEGLCAFCRGIQAGSPVDAYVTPEPWDMPGYQDKVIMAAGTFVSGASIELSADGPMKPPYTAFFQGALTYESGKRGVLFAAQSVLDAKNTASK